MYKAE